MADGWGELNVTDFGRLSINPLRKLKFEQTVEPNPEKTAITLQLGDPTIFGNFPPPKELRDALREAVESDVFNYNIAHGGIKAREAVAEYSQHLGKVTADDVILASGCGHALELSILTLVGIGENLLIPRPCYNYRTWTDGSNIETKFYDLDPSKNWKIDLKQMESLIDAKTRAILVNHPGNPCGNVFSKEHILDILKVAERYKLPIIADEVYEFMVFPGVEYHSFASLSKNVPVLTCSALSKRFLVPGIRMGWIVLSDRHGALKEVKKGLHNVTGRMLGPNSTVQLALPDILKKTPQSFFDDTIEKLHHHALTAFKLLSKIQGLQPIMPQGAMYMMIRVELEKFPGIKTCREFAERLIEEESVLLFPASPCFNYPGFIRIVLMVPEELIEEACGRIDEFCKRHIQH